MPRKREMKPREGSLFVESIDDHEILWVFRDGWWHQAGGVTALQWVKETDIKPEFSLHAEKPFLYCAGYIECRLSMEIVGDQDLLRRVVAK